MSSINRRDFSLIAGTTCVASALPQVFADAKKPARKIGFGFSLYGMKSLKIEDAITACAEIGYDCIELPVQTGWPGDSVKLSAIARKSIQAKLQSTSLRLSCLMENLHAVVDDKQHQSNLDRLKHADLFH